MAKALENACLQEGGDKVVSVTSQEQDGSQESVHDDQQWFAGYAARDLLRALCRR